LQKPVEFSFLFGHLRSRKHIFIMGKVEIEDCTFKEFFTEISEAEFIDMFDEDILVEARSIKEEVKIENWKWTPSSATASVGMAQQYKVEAKVVGPDIFISCACKKKFDCAHILAFCLAGIKEFPLKKESDHDKQVVVEIPGRGSRPTPNQEMAKIFADLNPAEVSVLICLAIVQKELENSVICDLLNYIPDSIVGKSNFTQRDLNAMIKKLKAKGIVKESSFLVSIGGREAAHQVLLFATWEKLAEFRAVGIGARVYIEKHRTYYYSNGQSKQYLIAGLQRSFFYLHEKVEAAELIGVLYKQANEPIWPFLSIAEDADLVKALPIEVQKCLLAMQGKVLIESNGDFRNSIVFKRAIELAKATTTSTTDELFLGIATDLICLNGDKELLEQLIAIQPDHFCCFLAKHWSAFISTEAQNGTEAAEIVLKLAKKAYAEFTVRPPLRTLWLLTFFSAMQGNMDEDQLMKKVRSLQTAKFGYPTAKKLYEAISHFLNHKHGDAKALLHEAYPDFIMMLLQNLIRAWVNLPPIALSNDQQKSAKVSGLPLLLLREVHEIQLRAKLPPVAVDFDQLTKINAWRPSFIHLVKSVEDWEISLNALLKMGEKDITIPTSPRLVWILSPKTMTLAAYEQKPKKDGGYSPGRHISVYYLASNTNADHFDNNVIALASKQNSYYARDIDVIDVATGLAGHPRIFLEDSLAQVQFVDTPVTVGLRKRSDGQFEFGFQLSFTSQDDVLVTRETPTKYLVHRIDQQHKQILSALGKERIIVPAEASGRLEQVVKYVSEVVQVQSTVAEMQGNIPEIDTDARVYVQIVAIGSGFLVELLVRPLTPVPTYCVPGVGDANIFGLNEERNRIFGLRDLENETKQLKTLIAATPALANLRADEGTYLLEQIEQALNLLSELQPQADADQIVLEWPKGEAFRIAKYADQSKFSMKIKSNQDWFSVSGKLTVDEETVLTMQEVFDQLQLNGRFIKLKGNQYLAITQALEAQLRALQGVTQTRSKSDELFAHGMMAGTLQELISGLSNVETDTKWKDKVTHLQSVKDKTYALPKGLKADLRPYQTEGYKWLLKLADWGAGACLADDMGLGKTLQIQAVFLQRAKLGPALVVAPASVVRNWVAEINRFTPSLKPLLFSDTTDREALLRNAKANDVVIVTYNLIQRETDLFTAYEFSTIVLDEAQAIKNTQTKRADTVRALQGKFKIIATGTPLENHLGELWSLFEFINPGLLGSIDHFQQKYIGPIERDKNEQRRADLRRLVQPFLLRRLKKDHLKDLPGKTEITLTVELTKEEQAFYEAIRRNAIAAIAEMDGTGAESGKKSLRVLAEIMRLRQACCNPRLVDENIVLPCSKLKLFAQTINELRENGHRALVFSQFVKHLDLLREHLDEQDISYQYLDGSTPTAKRQAAIEAFQAGEGDLFLISLKAGGAGINLTGADYVLHMDPWWNPAVEDQATDRAHRLGQTKPVTVYRFITADTIEEKIVKLHEHKRDLADSLLEGSDMSARINTNDLIELLKNH
jgi:SNF2 family DNA or RNA helicase